MKPVSMTFATTQRANARYGRSPFVCQNMPFVCPDHTPTLPNIGNKLPFVGIQAFRGFTLVELMITLAIFAIIAAFAAPSFQQLIMNNRIRADAADVVQALNLARSESVKLKVPVGICSKDSATDTCSGTNNWANGWLMWEDSDTGGTDGDFDVGTEKLVRRFTEYRPGVTLVTDSTAGAFGTISYLPDGRITAAAPKFIICIDDAIKNKEIGRDVSVTMTGRVKLDTVTCS